MEISIQEIQDKFGTLPEKVQWAVMGAKVDEHIMEIGAQNKITIEQMGELSLATHMIILGFVGPDKFEGLVQDSLKLPKEKTQKIVGEVNEKILKKIRENMMDSSNQSQTPTPQPPQTQQAPQPQQTAPIKITIPKPPIPDPASTVHTLKDDMQTLKKAGIDLMPDVKNAPNAHTVAPIPRPTPPTTQPQNPIPVRDALNTVNARGEEMLKQEWHLGSGGNTPAKSIEAQKFAGTFQIPKTQTDYAMKNISKTTTPAPTINKDQKTSTDPYREVIE